VLASWLSALIVGVALLTVAGIAALAGKNRLSKATPPVPQEAVHGLKADLLTPSAQVTTRCLDSSSH
jgi:Putative Actinobacterial Holin-X, holin superfamily III